MVILIEFLTTNSIESVDSGRRVAVPPFKVCIYLSITVMSIGTNLSKWDVLSFSTYKYVSMIALVAFGLVVRSTGAYYAALAYVSGAILFFLGRTLKLRIEPEVMQVHGGETSAPVSSPRSVSVMHVGEIVGLVETLEPTIRMTKTEHIMI